MANNYNFQISDQMEPWLTQPAKPISWLYLLSNQVKAARETVSAIVVAESLI